MSPLCFDNNLAKAECKSPNHPVRDNSLDWIAGLLILVVIVQHIDNLSEGSVGWEEKGFRDIFYYYMAWFYFKNGMFENKGISIRQSYHKIWLNLVRPYLFFSILSWVFWVPQYLSMHDYSWKWLAGATIQRFYSLGYIPANGALWFLISLIVARLMYPWIKKTNWNNYVIAVICMIPPYIYYVLYNSGIIKGWIFLPLPQAFIACAIFAIASELKSLQYKRWLFLLAIIGYIIEVWFKLPTLDMPLAGLPTPELGWLLSLPLWTAGIIAINNIVRLLPEWWFRVFNLGYIGRNSMSYYCGHFIILTNLVYFYQEKGYTLLGLPLAWAMAVSCLVVLPVADILLRRYLPWAVGKKGRKRSGHELGTVSDPLP